VLCKRFGLNKRAGGKSQSKLFSAHARSDLLKRRFLFQDARCLADQLVAKGMAICVVDDFKIIKISHENIKLLAWCVQSSGKSRDVISKAAPVEEAR